VRRSDQYVSLSRFSEGAIFDDNGVARGFGYLAKSPPIWLSKHSDGILVDKKTLSSAPYHPGSYLIFYNGNLQNYYHWLLEGLLPLDVLTQAMEPVSNLKIVLPKSMDIAAVFDHRGTLRALGFDHFSVEEVSANLIRVGEALWVEPGDFTEQIPAIYVSDFQRRIAAKYADFRQADKRRLLIVRKGAVRKIYNLPQVEAFLRNRGFETVVLEDLDFVDQILLFQSAEFVVGAHGAGLANLVFCEPGTKIIEFMPTAEMRPFFWSIAEKLKHVYAMQFCAPVGTQGFQAPIDVDIEKLGRLFRMIEA
jgi:capsular polysaccharide biosynthesis protein